MNPRSLALAFGLLLAPLVAQTAATTAPQVVFTSVGPDGWRMRFAPTNLGTLLSSERGRELWQPGALPLVEWLQDRLGSDPHERLLAYGGRIRLGIWLQEGDLGEQGPFAAALVLEGDGRTDLQALAGDLEKLQAEAGGEWSDVEVGGRSLRVLTQGMDRMTAPIVGENHLLCVAAAVEELAAAMATAQAFAGTCDGKPPKPDAPALAIDVATPALLELARTANAHQPGRGDWPTWRALGFECLGASRFSLSTAGPHVQLELTQAFADAPRGLFAALVRTEGGLPLLRHLLPEGRSTWKLGHFDAVALFDTILAACEANDVDTADVRKEMREDLGVDLRDDLLAHMTTEVLLHGASLADLDRLDRTPWLLAFRLEDRAAFAASLETALAHAKPALTREATVEHGDARFYRYGNMLGYDLWFAVGADLFVIAGGEAAEDRLGALFDAAGAPITGEAPELPKALADVRRHLPPGVTGAAVGDLDSLAAIPLTLWLELLPQVAPFVEHGAVEMPDEEQTGRVQELLRAHRLDVLRTATGYADHTWRWRIFW